MPGLPVRKAFSKDSDDRVTIVLRRGFCPPSLIKSPAAPIPPVAAAAAATTSAKPTGSSVSMFKFKEGTKTKTEKSEAATTAGLKRKQDRDDQSTQGQKTGKIAGDDKAVPSTSRGDTKDKNSDIRWYKVCYAKASMRKHKRFDLDGFLRISKQNTHGQLKSSDGTFLGSLSLKFTDDRRDGEIFQFCGQDVQVDCELEGSPEFDVDEDKEISSNISDVPYAKRMKFDKGGGGGRKNDNSEDEEEEEEVKDLSPASLVGEEPTEQNGSTNKPKPNVNSSIYQRYQPLSSSSSRIINAPNPQEPSADPDEDQHYTCVYSKKSKRKNIRWEKDGYLTISRNMTYGVLRDEDFNIVYSGRYNFNSDMIRFHVPITFAGKDLRIDDPLDERDLNRLLVHLNHNP